MAVFSRRTVYLLLAALIIVSVALRYPTVDHERYQADSYYVHHLSQAIVNDERAMWTFSPLSYVGYYPLSYPSGMPFLIADTSIATGLSVEFSILLLGIVLGLLACLAAFCVAREFVKDPGSGLFVTFIVVAGSRFIDTTYWVGSARGILVVLMILTVFAAFRASSRGQNRLLWISGLFGFGCIAVHHMAVLFFFFGFALVITAIVFGYISRRTTTRKRRVTVTTVGAIAFAVAAVSFGFFSVFEDAVGESFGETPPFDFEPKFLAVIVHMAASYTNQIGFIVPIAVLGIPFFLRNTPLNQKAFYPLILLLTFVPLMGLSLYITMLIAPFMAVVGVYWMKSWFRTGRRKKLAVLVICVFVAVSLALPPLSVARWNNESYMTNDVVEVPNQVVLDAAYVSYSSRDGGYVICNTNVLAARLAALTDADFLGSGIRSVLVGDVDADDLRDNVTLSLEGFPANLYRFLDYESEFFVDQKVNSLMASGASFAFSPSGTDYYNAHPKLIIIVDNDWPATLVTQYFNNPAPFLQQLENAYWTKPPAGGPLDSYMVYQSDRVSEYYVSLPKSG